MEHIAKSADRLQVAEHPRDEQAPRTTNPTSAGVSRPDVAGKRPGEPALAIVAERHGRDAARPAVAQLVRTSSEVASVPSFCSSWRKGRPPAGRGNQLELCDRHNCGVDVDRDVGEVRPAPIPGPHIDSGA
jgi:hypothetical protein